MADYEIIIEIHRNGRLILEDYEYGPASEVVSNSKSWLDRWKREIEERVYADDE